MGGTPLDGGEVVLGSGKEDNGGESPPPRGGEVVLTPAKLTNGELDPLPVPCIPIGAPAIPNDAVLPDLVGDLDDTPDTPPCNDEREACEYNTPDPGPKEGWVTMRSDMDIAVGGGDLEWEWVDVGE